MSSIRQILRNLLQRVDDDGKVHSLTEVVLIAQDVDYTTGPDGVPARVMKTTTHRFECSAKQLRAVIDALLDRERELLELNAAADEVEGGDRG